MSCIMGKSKQLEELTSPSTLTVAGNPSFSRMNFLYQASQLASQLPGNTTLTCYYGRIMKEIAMKMVEKIHPDIKKTLCSSCNYSLTGHSRLLDVKIKGHQKKRRKSKLNRRSCSNYSEKYFDTTILKKSISDTEVHHKYKKSRIKMRTRRPNKIYYTCKKCKFSKGYLLKPNHTIQLSKLNPS